MHPPLPPELIKSLLSILLDSIALPESQCLEKTRMQSLLSLSFRNQLWADPLSIFYSNKPCLAFLRGECKYGRRCKFSHDPQGISTKDNSSQPCPYLGTAKSCFRGKSCRYSHNNTVNKEGTTPQSSQPNTRSRPKTEAETGFRKWTFLIPKPGTRTHLIETEKFFQLGWNLMNKDNPETKQQIIKKLASEEGLGVIKRLADDMANSSQIRNEVRVFKDKMLPFLRTISHRDVVSSLILETPLDTIYTFFYGPNGHRALQLFTSITSALSIVVWEELSEKEDLAVAAITATLAVLEKIIELNQTAQVVEGFTPIVEKLSNCIPEQVSHAGVKSLERVRKRLGLGALMPLYKGHASNQSAHRPVFQMSLDLPGELSELGPRHDNDHADICDIKILPTTEEIQSTRLEYLPSIDPSTHHLPSLAGLLDQQFRLLREDAVGQLRDAVLVEYRRLTEPSKQRALPQQRNNEIKANVYHKVALLHFEFDRRKGLQIVAEFDQPLALAKKGSKEREEWWKNSKRLQTDAFVCFISATGRAVFFTVCDPTPTPPPKSRKEDEETATDKHATLKVHHERPSLFRQRERSALILSLVEDSSEDVTWIASHLSNSQKQRQSLIEFPGILLPSFKPTLQALQQMSRTLDLPFSELIAPNAVVTEDVNPHPPTYSRRPGFSFNLETLVNGEQLTLVPGQPFQYHTLQKKSTLDDAQQRSIINALGSSLALIQGPPGTGKSYSGIAIIKALLRNRKRANLGPIICVCYTNHALDQLLEHLVKDGVQQLIRLGSRSKSELLQNLNLHHVSKDVKSTKSEGHQKYLLYHQLDDVLQEIEALIPGLEKVNDVKDYLSRHHFSHFNQLFRRGVDENGFQEVRGRKFNVMHSWLNGAPKRLTSTRQIPELIETNLQEMSSAERSTLHKYWIQENSKDLSSRLLHILESYRHIQNSLKRYHQEIDLRCLLSAQVIGVTTTGMAQNLDVLRRVRAKVVLFEEAGEILEAHTLTALLPSVEHAILIGDHEQLRPQINNYDFQYDNPRGAKFSLDISLFERLVHPKSGNVKLPYSSLELQRRMHPSISELVRSTLYPRLQDHASVSTYPEVNGMRKRLFWLDHDEPEDSSSSTPSQSFSKTNAWEVEMVAALVSHLVSQGVYQNEDIAVITPYLGQLQKLKQRLRTAFAIVVGDRDTEELEMKGLGDENGEETSVAKSSVRKTTLLNALRIATVDNFQGEEAKVIVISLVRSNEERRCGFLKTSNRINVLLSRAQHGMYIVGNVNTARPVPMWDKVLTILERDGNVGKTLELRCPRHEETEIKVSKPDDFSIFSPEGGCNRKCISRLGCGHACINKCHSDVLHDSVRCLEKCLRTKKGCQHSCRKACGDPCDSKCQEKVSNITLPCGHVQASLACHQAQAPKDVRCRVVVDVVMPGCRHMAKIHCFEVPSLAKLSCKAMCDAVLQCGHNCQRPCKSCRKGGQDGQVVKVDHGTCLTKCGRSYNTCSHTCQNYCHGDTSCGLCLQPCQVRCSHSICIKQCHEPCMPCAERCSWSCPHRGACELPCGVPCSLLPCSKRCSLILNCGHRCPSICGEICPDSRYCRECADKSIKEMMVDYIMGLTYADVDLDKTPCIIPSCGHILTSESMDGHMEISKYYTMADDPDAEEPIVALKSASEPFSSSELKNCPMCRRPLRDINRYGRIVRRAWIDEATKKFIVWANSSFVPLVSRMEQVEAKLREPLSKEKESKTSPLDQLSSAVDKLSLDPIQLVGSCEKQLLVVRKVVKSVTRYKDIFRLREVIYKFRQQVDEAEQPISRIHDLLQDARKKQAKTEDIDLPSVLQVRNRLLATVLLLRCEYTILSEFVTRSVGTESNGSPRELRLDFALIRNDCDTLLKESSVRQQPAQAVEGLLYWARFAALERGHSATLSKDDITALIKRARNHLRFARDICNKYPSQTAGMPDEISQVEKMLREGTFYEPVTNAEQRAVYRAMAQSFQGTGHWYYCVNMHPFTVGECGMPMERARCPQCEATVGGTHHQPVEGVTRAADLEELGRREGR